MIVYCAGGMRSGWQAKVKKALPSKCIILNPASFTLSEAEEYTARDLYLVRKADVVLANIERDNPSGVGLALEVGYGKALGCLVVLVDNREWGLTTAKYFDIVANTADVVFDELEEALAFLKTVALQAAGA